MLQFLYGSWHTFQYDILHRLPENSLAAFRFAFWNKNFKNTMDKFLKIQLEFNSSPWRTPWSSPFSTSSKASTAFPDTNLSHFSFSGSITETKINFCKDTTAKI